MRSPTTRVLGLRRAWRLALGMLPFVALTYVQLLFATDTQRLLVLVAPGLVVLALEGVAELRERLAVPSMALLPGAVAVFLLVLTDRQDYDIAFAPQAIVIALTATLVVAVRVARLRAGAGSEPAL